MFIVYKNKKIQKICNSALEAEKKYGADMAYKIEMRIGEISSSESVEFMLNNHIGRCHMLKGERKAQYAVDLVHPFRLIFEKDGKEIRVVRILEITDYH